MSDLRDSFYIDDNSNAHRASSVGYSKDSTSVSTFCDSKFEIESKKELDFIPIRLLSKDEICVKCEQNYQRINHNRFNFTDDEDYEYIFFVKFIIKFGDRSGSVITETVGADCEEEAKNKIENKYDLVKIYKYNYISKSGEYGEWKVTTDNRDYK